MTIKTSAIAAGPTHRRLVAVTSETYEQLRYGLPNLRTFVSSLLGCRAIPKAQKLKKCGIRDVDNNALRRELDAAGEMLGVLNAPGIALWDIVEKAEDFLSGLKTWEDDKRGKGLDMVSEEITVDKLLKENHLLRLRLHNLATFYQEDSNESA